MRVILCGSEVAELARSGQPQSIDETAITVATLEPPPGRLGGCLRAPQLANNWRTATENPLLMRDCVPLLGMYFI